MKDCTGLYNYKGFTYYFSEMYQEWNAEPNFLIKEFKNKIDETTIINFIGKHQYDLECQKTIANMKKEINKAIAEGYKDKLIQQFKKEYNL